MKKVILKSMFLSSLLLMTSCASGSYVKSVSFWHIGDFLEFVVIVGLGALVFLLYNKIQSIMSSSLSNLNRLPLNRIYSQPLSSLPLSNRS